MKLKTFTATVSAFVDDCLVSMPGFSHRGQPFKVQTFMYPFEERKVKAHFFAPNRTKALRQLSRVGVHDIRDLDGGVMANVPNCIQQLFTKD